MDPLKKTKVPAFDQAKVAVALAAAAHQTFDAQHLPFTRIAFTKDYKAIMVADSGKEWSCDVRGSKCTALAAGTIPQPAAWRAAPLQVAAVVVVAVAAAEAGRAGVAACHRTTSR